MQFFLRPPQLRTDRGLDCGHCHTKTQERIFVAGDWKVRAPAM